MSKFVGKSIVDVISTVCFDVEAKQLKMSDGCNRICGISMVTVRGLFLDSDGFYGRLPGSALGVALYRPLIWPDVDVVWTALTGTTSIAPSHQLLVRQACKEDR